MFNGRHEYNQSDNILNYGNPFNKYYQRTNYNKRINMETNIHTGTPVEEYNNFDIGS